MPNYGFAIDLRKCIGCHACTIACKSEHQIPIGVNRCWVKTVEKGTFPDTRRFFFPVLCNQCDEAPCVRICPTGALFKRRDGIVDLHGDSCIGCRACMVACPYDQLFIDPGTHTAEKCNFCANRIENRLEPACVSVCPTQCRIFGDLDDPTSEVAIIARSQAISVRKPEKGTRPKVIYLAAEESAIRPEEATRPFWFKEGQVRLRPVAAPAEDPARPGAPRVDYDMPHEKAWGIDMALYLLTKGISSGAMLLSALLWWLGLHDALTTIIGPAIALVAVAMTAVILVVDLERPERFYYILVKPNWRSWMVWGAYFLTVHGGICTLWLAASWFGFPSILTLLAVPAIIVSVLTTSYTGFLFAQGLARDLWQGPHAAFDLLAQALAEGSAAMLLAAAVSGSGAAVRPLTWVLLGALGVHLLLIVFENLLAPSPSRHHELATEAIRRGPFARVFWGGAIVGGGLVPLALLTAGATPAAGALSSALAPIAALLALVGNFAWEYIWVEAGQSVPLS
ncbi:MAG TPA: NrfD/PsrC family molybdoenzyme membrane anchor subunit [Vicinamibacterales bacterium]|nr:NrfD/PsrC family molybdoenzyme membrane anchor subunit [Vicinamibacterales bacterium]